MEYMTWKKSLRLSSKIPSLVSTIVMDAEIVVPREPLSMPEKIRDGFLLIKRQGSNLWDADVMPGNIEKMYW
jgi:hypothetical protein